MGKNTKIKAVIWDSVGVLTFVVGESFAHLWAGRLGVPVEAVYRAFAEPGPNSHAWDLGEISEDAYHEYFIEKIGLPKEKQAALKVTIDDFYYDTELLEYIRGLKNSYTTALLTVVPLEYQEMLRKHWPEFETAFDHVVTSAEVHLVKPDPRIYHLTLDRIGCRAEEAVFIDDTEENVIAAAELGIRSILFKEREQAIGELESILAKNLEAA